MKTKRWTRTTEIKVEHEELYLLHRSQRPIDAWCARCAAQVRMVTPEEAANFASVTSRTIYRWLEDGRLHFLEEPGGELFICSQSLALVLRLIVEARV